MPLLLLDSDVEENSEVIRDTTDRLYGGNTEHRLRQEMLLGVGGVRAIRVFCRLTGASAPEVFHTNEGHAGFLGVERIRELTDATGGNDALTFEAALEVSRAGTRVHHPHARCRPASTGSPVTWSSSTSAATTPTTACRSSGSSPWDPRTTRAATPPCSTWR